MKRPTIRPLGLRPAAVANGQFLSKSGCSAAGGALILMLGLAGCATAPTKLACPTGQAEMRTAQLFLAAKTPASPSEKDIRGFVAAEVAPRFPDGVTVIDGGGQWKGDDNRMIRDAA